MKVSIVGAGRAGGSFANAIAAKVELRALVHSERRPNLPNLREEMLAGWDTPGVFDVDVLLIAVRDKDIRGVSERIAKLSSVPSMALHLSGSLDSDELSALAGRGVETGSMHPLISLSNPDEGSARLNGAYFCIEGTAPATKAAEEIARLVGGKPFAIAREYKALYHASAVMASGHVTALFDTATDTLSRCGLSPAEAKEVLMPLIESTIENLKEADAAEALTGPFARGDHETFAKHVAALSRSANPEVLAVYLELAERSVNLVAGRSHPPPHLEELAAAISMAKGKTG